MLVTKARLFSFKRLKTLVKVVFHFPVDIDPIQLMQSIKVHGYLAFSPDELKKEVEEAMANTSIGIDEYGKSKSKILRGVIYQLWLNGETEKSSEQFYLDLMNQIIEFYKKKI